MNLQASTTATPLSTVTTLRRPLAVAAGALLVALAAQIAVPLPFTPIPATLQPAAVLIVGGLLGPRLGAASLVLYLVLGAAGLPVFTPVGLPGAARLLGPTGGYLLAYPAAAALAGWWTSVRRSLWDCVAAMLAGMALIHLGGLAQLAVLSGGIERAFEIGSRPFLLADALKAGFAGLVVRRLAQSVRTRI
jgi:biotin transport system substrate-specific component